MDCAFRPGAVNWALALLSAALLILCFPGYNLFWLAPVALTPLIIAAAREPRTWRRFWLGYVSGALYWFSVCNWIQFTIQTHGGMSSASAWFVFVLFTLAKALQTGAFAMLAGWTMRTKLAIPVTAALWVVIEYTHGPLGFAWLNLGNAGIDMGLPMRIAPIAGVWGISFFFAATAAEIANLVAGRRGIPGLGVMLIPLLFLLPRLPEKQPADQKAMMVQPNIDEAERWTGQSFALLLKRMKELSVGSNTSLLVWPEAPAPFYDDDPVFMDYAEGIARENHEYFLTGLISRPSNGAMYNSAVVISPDGKVLTRYDKVNLVPFGEFIPWPLGPIAFRITNEAGDFQPGNRQVISPVGGHKLATFICYESVFPRFISGFVRRGAEVLVNPSNDGWFGKTAARFQHLEIVRMRAAENARWILRDTNDGISAAIDPAGRLRQQLALYQETSGVMGFSYSRQTTFYTRWGDWLVVLCLVMAAAGVVVGGYSGTSTWVRISSRMRSPASARRPPSALRG